MDIRRVLFNYKVILFLLVYRLFLFLEFKNKICYLSKNVIVKCFYYLNMVFWLLIGKGWGRVEVDGFGIVFFVLSF